MFNALKTMNGSILNERPLRVKRAIEKSKLEKKVKNVIAKKINKKGYTAPRDPKKLWKVPAKHQRLQGGKPDSGDNDNKSNARKFHFKRKMIKK